MELYCAFYDNRHFVRNAENRVSTSQGTAPVFYHKRFYAEAYAEQHLHTSPETAAHFSGHTLIPIKI